VRPWAGIDAGCGSRFHDRLLPVGSPHLAVLHGLIFEQAYVNSLENQTPAPRMRVFRMTGIVPEILGLHLSDALQISTALGMHGRQYAVPQSLLLWCRAGPADLVGDYCVDWDRGHSAWLQSFWSLP